MATDVWALSAIASPVATDRIPIATGSNTGGYSPRSEFAWRLSTGEFDVFGGNTAKTVMEFGSAGGGSNLGIQIKGTLTALPSAQIRSFIATGDSALGTAGDLLIAARSDAACSIRFMTGASGVSEAARINASGHLGIGVAPSARLHVKSSGEIARLETTTARGGGLCYLSLNDPSGSKGYIGYGGASDAIEFCNNLNASMHFYTNGIIRWAIGSTGSLQPAADNSYNLGNGSARIATVFAATGTINTSDAREKTTLRAFTAAEMAAAKRIAAEIGIFQFMTGVRLHVGVIAQQVWAIMADEGLIDPLQEGVTPSSPYAFLCWDEVEDRPEGRFGIRPDQLSLFLIAAQEARIAALEDLLP